MKKQWFVFTRLTGQESKVRMASGETCSIEEMSDYIGDVIIPTEKVSEVKRGVKYDDDAQVFSWLCAGQYRAVR
jgi:transcription termination/antitermination protein NusG